MTNEQKRPSVVAELEKLLYINEHELERECREQPSVFYKVSKQLPLAISRRDAAKLSLEEVEAKVDAKIRHDAEVSVDKITEKGVESKKTLDPNVKKAKELLLGWNREVGQLQALREAFNQRHFALKDLVALYLANYYGAGSEVSPSRAAGEVARERLNDKRQQDQRRLSVHRVHSTKNDPDDEIPF